MDSSIFSFVFFLTFVLWIVRTISGQATKSKQNAEKPMQRPVHPIQTTRGKVMPSTLRQTTYNRTFSMEDRPRMAPKIYSTYADGRTLMEREGYTAGGDGSMEGIDPCHDNYETYVPYAPEEQVEQHAQPLATNYSLDHILNLQGQGLVQGIIFSEVLTRKPIRRPMR